MINMQKFSRLQAACAAASMALFLSACQTAQMPAPTTVKAAVAWQEDVAAQYSVDEAWWQQYQDTQLNQLVDAALRNNVDLQQAALTVRQAMYQANAEGAGLLPSVSGSLSGSTSKNIKEGGSSGRSYGGQLGVSYEIDLWQRLRDSADAKVWQFRATEADLATARLSLINSTVNTYFELVYLQAAIDHAQNNIRSYQQLLNISNSKYRHGKVASIEPAQAQQALSNAEASLLNLQSQQQAAEQTLRTLLHLKPNQAWNLNVAKLDQIKALGVNTHVPLSVLANRPDLRAAEYQLRASYKDWAAMQKSVYPSVTLGANLSSSSRNIGQALNVPILGGNVGISLPFLNWNELKWNIRISEVQYQSQLLAFEQSINQALNEVDGLYFAYQQALQTEKNTAAKLAAEAKIRHYYQTRYERGAAEFKDHINAQSSYDSAYLDWLNSRYVRLQAENKVYQSMAGYYR
ncbi:outer membrane efflux protein [Vitreoscilla sp. C1]|nr:outer membrane efflux protein [Vitreoscilla sp. C1]